MKKFFLALLTVAVSSLLSSCDSFGGDNPVVEEEINNPEEVINHLASIILNGEDPEVFNVIKDNGDVLSFFGTKDAKGGVTSFTTVELKDINGNISILSFNEDGKIESFIAPNNVEFDFEWINDEEAVLKVFNPEDNSYIVTNWNINKVADAYAVRALTRCANPIMRSGNIEMKQITNVSSQNMQRMITRADHSEYDVFVRKCDSPVNAKVHLECINSKTAKTEAKIYKYQYITQGWYSFKIPDFAFSTTYNNEELLKNIDVAVSGNWDDFFAGTATNLNPGIAPTLSAIIAGGVAILPAIEFALAATGVGIVPAAVIGATAAFVGLIYGAAEVLSYAKPSDFVKKFNPDFAYRHVTNTFVVPVVNGKRYTDEGFLVDWNDDYWSSVVNLEGSPSILSFSLQPSHPTAGQSYVATAYYSCIPKGSKIDMSIVGTDNYKNNTTQYAAAENGYATLSVPGAHSGVYDVCTVLITDPNGKIIGPMTASLTFGN